MLPYGPIMLDPRSLQERRDEIVESCEARHIRADVDGAISLQERTNGLRTELNEANRLRNEHQKAGKQKLDDAARAEAGGPEAAEARAARAPPGQSAG